MPDSGISFLQTLFVSFEAIGRLFLVALVGFIFVRRKWMSETGLSNLARLMIDVVVPCALSVSMMKGFKRDTLDTVWPLIMLPPIFMSLTVLASTLYFRLWPGKDRTADRAAAAMSGIPNSFYVPFPLAIAVTPPEYHVLVGVLLGSAVLAINPLQWTMGTWLLMGEAKDEGGRNWLASMKHTLNGPVIGVIGGVLLSQVPGFPEAARAEPGSFMPLRMVLQAMALVGQAMAPLAMIIIGGLIAGCSLRRAISFRLLLPIIGFRFVIVPGIVYFLIVKDILPVTGLAVFALLLEAASPPAMNLTLVAKRYGGDWDIVSGMQLICSLIAILALPIWMTIGLRM